MCALQKANPLPPAGRPMPRPRSASSLGTDSLIHASTPTKKERRYDQEKFRDAYEVLQQHAQTLREQAEPSVDDLLTIVTEAVAACNVCKVRIDAVEAALKVALDSAGVGGVAVPSATAAQERNLTPAAAPASASTLPSSFEDMDDDIPF